MEFLDFFKNALNLKKISRQGWIDKLSIEHPESVADHSYSMAIMGMVISDFENHDTEKILKMILLHDLAESKIGDFTPEQITNAEIWKEYQNQISVESQFVHQIDRLEMALQAKMYEKSGSSKENIATFLQTAKSDITHPKLKELFTKIVEDQ